MSTPGASGITRRCALHFLKDVRSTSCRPIGVSEATARAGVPEGSTPRRRQGLCGNAGLRLHDFRAQAVLIEQRKMDRSCIQPGSQLRYARSRSVQARLTISVPDDGSSMRQACWNARSAARRNAASLAACRSVADDSHRTAVMLEASVSRRSISSAAIASGKRTPSSSDRQRATVSARAPRCSSMTSVVACATCSASSGT